MRRSRYPLILIIFVISVFSLLFKFANAPITQPVGTAVTPQEISEDVSPTVAADVPPAPDAVTTPSGALEPVIKVVDGDTITVELDGRRETVRLIGINTPETVDPRKTVQCFGREASDKAKTVLQGTAVRLEADSTQGDRDKYGRLLRYVYLPDGTFFNQLMVEEGFAYEYTYALPYAYQEEFKTAQEAARLQEKGLWSATTCNGKL